MEIRVAVILFLCIGSWIFFAPRNRRLRGRELITQRQASRAQKRLRQDDGRVHFGSMLLPKKAETSHFLFLGTTGSGKTLSIKRMMAEALADLGAAPDQRALVYDPKQDQLSFLHGLGLPSQVVTLNPFDRRSASWAIAQDVTGPAAALEVAAIFIPEERSHNRFFSDAARDLLCEVMKAFILQSPRCWTLRDVIAATRSLNALWSVLSCSPDGRQAFESYFADERTAANVLATLRSRLAPLSPIAALWSKADTAVSLEEWAREDFVLVLGSSERVRTALDTLNRVIFKRAVELVLSQSESRTRRNWFFLDEVREAGKLDGLSTLLTKGRSKGASVVLGFQDVEGMKAAYGDRLGNEIMAMCSNKAILRLESAETAAWASKQVGEFERIEIRRSLNTDGAWLPRYRTRSEQRIKGDAVLPSEFLSTPPADTANGVTGHFITPFVGAYRNCTPLSTLLARAKSANDVLDFIPRQEDEEWLTPWGADDFHRLRIVERALEVDRAELCQHIIEQGVER